jgi:uncharacterized RDD family membrane protein YckC
VTARRRPDPPAATGTKRANASLVRRYAALAYEGLLLAAIVLVTGFATLPFVSPTLRISHMLEVPSVAARVFSACVEFGVAGIYFVWSWTGGRRTLPMQTWRIALVLSDQRPVDARTAVIRYLAAWIGPLASLVAYEALAPGTSAAQALWLATLNYLWPIVDPERQFLHDRIAGTRIVMDRAA